MKRALLTLAALGVCAAGCSVTASTRIKNPLNGSELEPNAIEFVDTVGEAQYDLPPRTLLQRASLVTLDASEACFRLVLKAIDQERSLASPTGWHIKLEGEPEFEETTYELREERAETETIVHGSIERQAVTTQQICGDGGRCASQNAVTTYRDPVDFALITGGGTLCFKNQGHIKPQSEQITLALARPSGPRNLSLFDLIGGVTDDRMAFRWNFR